MATHVLLFRVVYDLPDGTSRSVWYANASSAHNAAETTSLKAIVNKVNVPIGPTPLAQWLNDYEQQHKEAAA